MNLQRPLTDPVPSQCRKLILLFPLLTLLMMPLGCQGLLQQREIQYARSAKMPDELNGFARIAQIKVMATVIGADAVVGEMDLTEPSAKPNQRYLSAYLAVHELDLAKLIHNTQKLQTLLADKDVAALAKSKGLYP